jgi:GT2 family glycosyltransferase
VTVAGGAPRPLFTSISAVYNVERYLPDFLAGLEAQAGGLDDVELLFVDDGSTDGSRALLEAWAQAHPHLNVAVLHQANAGQGPARNLGLTRASGLWVTFPDPDDVLDRRYFATMRRANARWPEADMLAARRLLWYEDLGLRGAAHPMGHLYTKDQLVNLAQHPDYFAVAAPSAFLRLDRLQERGLRFNPRLRPNFEDGQLCVEYLLASPEPRIAFCKSAVYHYRKRGDGSSTLQNSTAQASRFTVVPREAYWEDLREGARRYGTPPAWLQNFILYELSWYFSGDKAPAKTPTAAFGRVADEFVATLREIAALLDPAVVEAFDGRPLGVDVRAILLHGLAGGDWAAGYIARTRVDETKRQVRLKYLFSGRVPEVVCRDADGTVVTPVAGKIRAIDYFSHTLLREWIGWVPDAPGLRVEVDGRPVPVTEGDPLPPGSQRPVRASGWKALSQAADTLADGSSPRQVMAAMWNAGWALIGDADMLSWLFTRRDQWMGTAWALVRNLAARLVCRLAPPAQFRDAWLVMDWLEDADDNGERLFRHLRAHRPDINAWFVINKDSADYRKLRRDGLGRWVVPYGTFRWMLLAACARHLVSSSANVEVMSPPKLWWLPKQWDYTFLQHGVIKDDISRWLNPKAIDLFVTSTPAEQESIAGDNTPYVFTSKEARRVGLARFDRLRRLGRATPPEDRDLVLLTPTWRQDLSAPAGKGQRMGVVEGFEDTEFARNWWGLLGSSALLGAAREAGVRVGFLPHPNLQPILDRLPIPDGVEILRYEGTDIQALLARCRVMVTDFSSQAFNAGFLGRPVVYFQFDADSFFNGAGASRPGYFDYARDGFGPVVATPAEAADAVAQLLREGPGPYTARMDACFADVRDGRCCERTIAAIEDLDRP